MPSALAHRLLVCLLTSSHNTVIMALDLSCPPATAMPFGILQHQEVIDQPLLVE